MKNSLRSRQWSLITYASVDEFSLLLESALHYAFIRHDDDGVEPHFHILLVFKNARAFDGLKSLIRSEQNTLGEVVKSDLKSMFEYLLHENKDKKQYSIDDVMSDDIDFWLSCSHDTDNTTDTLIDDILSGAPLRVLARKYGRDFMKNYSAYINFARLVYSQESCGVVVGYEKFISTLKDKIDFDNLVSQNPDVGFVDLTAERKAR